MGKRKHGDLDCLGCGYAPSAGGFVECSNYKIWWKEFLETCVYCQKKIEPKRVEKQERDCDNCFKNERWKQFRKVF